MSNESQIQKGIEGILRYEKYPSSTAKKRKVFPFIFTEQSRLYVQKLSKQQQKTILTELQQFVDKWKIHGNNVDGASIHCLSDYFILIVVDESNTSLSGCGKDELFNCMEKIAASLQIRMLETGAIVYEQAVKGDDASSDRAGAVENEYFLEKIKLEKCMRHRLAQCIARGEIVAQSLIFDMSVSNLEDFATRFCRPAMRTWLAGKLPSNEISENQAV